MQEQRDAFCKSLDPTDTGVNGRIAQLSALLKMKVRPTERKEEEEGRLERRGSRDDPDVVSDKSATGRELES